MSKFEENIQINTPNPYDKAEEEANNKGNASTPGKFAMNIPKGKEKKEQMSLMFTKTHKQKARRIAKKHDMSVSELFGHLLDQLDEEE
ncbi:TPA: hypothetical protein ROY23_005278 [Bacillus wiedmannii]|nr:hypothetical protein [Bacillus wiedmannii]